MNIDLGFISRLWNNYPALANVSGFLGLLVVWYLKNKLLQLLKVITSLFDGQRKQEKNNEETMICLKEIIQELTNLKEASKAEAEMLITFAQGTTIDQKLKNHISENYGKVKTLLDDLKDNAVSTFNEVKTNIIETKENVIEAKQSTYDKLKNQLKERAD